MKKFKLTLLSFIFVLPIVAQDVNVKMDSAFCLLNRVLSSMVTAPAEQAIPKVIAHRGYWQTYGSAQNSIYSFERAAEIGVYGSEFDVHMTKDSVLVVNHDMTIGDMTIQEVPYSWLKDVKLSNGECLSTLRELLECARGTDANVKLIFELKSHATPELNREAARRSVEMIREKKLVYRTEFITFNLDAAKEFIRLAPDIPVYYLNGELSPKELKELGFAGLDYHINVMRKHPEWFDEAHKLGLGVNVWTVDDADVIKEMAANGADFITTNVPVEAMILLRNEYQKK